MRRKFRSAVVAAAAVALVVPLGAIATSAADAATVNLAAGKATTSSSTNAPYASGNVTDGNQGTYWESSSNAFPQWVQVDLGAAATVTDLALKLPSGWGARNQTIAVQGSADGSSFTTLKAQASYAFAPSANTVSVDVTDSSVRYVRVQFTANSGWPAAQLSELEVLGTAPMNPPVDPPSGSNLAQGRPASASSSTQTYVAANAVDGSATTYWEGADGQYPSTLAVNLAATSALTGVVVRLNPDSAWGSRTQTFEVQSRTGTGAWSTIKASAAYTFSPASGNQVTIPVTGSATDVRLQFTANTGAGNGQVAELQVWGTTSTQPARPDLVVSSVAATPGSPTPSDDVTLSAVVRNSGDGASTATTLAFTVGGQTVGTVNVGVLAAGAQTTVTASIGARAAGTYAIGATADPANTVVESNESNNAASGSFTVTSGPVEPPQGQNLALGRPATASSTEWTYVAGNAVDGSRTTYWEGAGGQYPSWLAVSLASTSTLSGVTVRLNPDAAWGARTQTFAVEGRTGTGSWSTLKASASYSFAPGSGNSVTIPLSGTASDVRLVFTGNTGSGNGQVAELEVVGTPAPNPDLVVTAVTASPASPVESDAITLSAVVRNSGTLASAATTVRFTVDGEAAATVAVGALAAGAQATVSASAGARAAGSYAIGALVDPANSVVEQNEANNGFTNPTRLTVAAVPSSDIIPVVSWNPSTPSAGASVTFTAAIANTGNVATGSGSHAVTVTLKDGTGATVKTFTGAVSGAVAPGATSAQVSLGTWTAANGNYTVTSVAASDATEVAGKQGNNTATAGIFVGRGASMPFDFYEAEDGRTGGGATVLAANRTVGDLAGEASGRRAVTLADNGAYVEWTLKSSTNTLVTRFSIPDSAGGTGQNGSIDIYAGGTFLKRLDLTSRFAWLYGNETNPGNTPSAGGPRHIYDEANVLLGTTVPAGTTIRLQKTASNPLPVTVDFVNTEQATAKPNPDTAAYITPAGFTHQDVQNALDKFRQDTTGRLKGVYLPAGDYSTASKFQVYGKAVDIVGAGPWFTRFFAPSGQENTDIGFRAEASSNGSKFRSFSYWGNYTSRIDGPGKVLDFTNVSSMTVDDLWVEHMICMFWANNMDNSSITNSRIRNTFADGINMTNGSANNRVANIEARGTGDDSFALFAATDSGGLGQTGNVYENLTSLVTWRAAGLAVYGGYGNTFRNIYIADTLVYSGITISSLDFGYPMDEFGSASPTSFQNISIVRAGGHFWGNQTFPAIWVFSASKKFQGIRVSDVDIVDPTYSGIMFQTNYVGSTPQNPITDTVFTNISITGARKSGDAWDAKSGFGIWANEQPEPGQGPAVGSVTFHNLRMSGNFQDIKNTTSTFTINRD
ncbi:CARDB domain-containing protein [Cellulomonas edaphi]|uniref:CARDB domain-containing protein n=1 Tax=Cellulomonas edaphi TaxID=3053468 RepID=A0ABT7S336_9CELL|nr:CARDB domain-containing protein [Cellulomons edaphi]MDM7830038.1 CARDB domain-containing protein [Cellulomons edaphi]